jgi:DNA-binding beta-propeller fold protein YncE
MREVAGMAQRVGSGEFVYEVDERWGQLPASWTFVDVVGVVVDREDRVYVFNRGAHPIVIFERDGRLAGAWGEGQFTNPHGLQIGPDGALYTVDNGDHTVRKWTPDGRLLLTLGTPGRASDTGYAGSLDSIRGGGPFNSPTNCAVAPDGSLYVSDGYGNCKVHHFSAGGELLRSWGEPGRGPGQFRLVHGICVAPDGAVYVGDRANNRVQVFSPTGEFLREWADVRQPDEIHLGPDGQFYVAELGYGGDVPAGGGLGARVTVRDAAGTILAAWGDTGDPAAPGNCAAPHGIRVDSHGDLYLGEVTYTARISARLVKPSCHCFQKFRRVR